VPEFQLSVAGDLGGRQPVRFAVEYECSDRDAIGIVRATKAPLVVVRGVPEGPATYFIYSWDEGTGHVDVAAAPENPIALGQPWPLANAQPAARKSALSTSTG
jgi:hypothetical protein